MQITCLASSSAGNCYYLDNGSSLLLLEAGIKYKDLVTELARKQLKLTDFKHCLISHTHKDHSVAANDLSRFMTICGSETTVKDVPGKKKELTTRRWYSLGEYQVLAIETEHDCEGSLAYIIKSKGETVLFLTDAKYIKYDLSSFQFDHILIECNYDDAVLGTIELHPALEKRLINSHMSLTTCVKTLKSFDLSKCKAIYLVHLSDRHANEQKMSQTVMKETGIPVYICGKYGGMR